MKNALILIGIVLFFVQCDQQNLSFKNFDQDNNGTISRSEFSDEFTSQYDADWDYNDDGILDNEDFYRTSYGIWDIDHDGYLTEDEWGYGESVLYGDYVGDFGVLDLDHNDFLDYNEYYTSLYNTDLYSTWDLNQDNVLSEEELAESIFNNWDTDNDGTLGKKEYKDLDSYYADL